MAQTVADYVAEFLITEGVKRVFGLPGGENVPLLDAFRRVDLPFVLTHHEAAAGVAADVTGQLTDIPGVCLSTVGPGSVNLVAAAAAATLERSPVLAITADIDTRVKDDVIHMKVDLNAMFGAVCKGSFTLTPANVTTVLPEAWRLAQRAPRGAVHVALSPDLAVQPISEPQLGEPVDPFLTVDEQALGQVTRRLDQAERPFMLVGVGVEAAVAHEELLALADGWQIPVAVTPKTKGQFPESHPLYAGTFTAYGDESLRAALAEADLIVGIGVDSVDFVTSTWQPETPVINLNLGGAADLALKPELALDGDLRAMLRGLHNVSRIQEYDFNGQERAAVLRQTIARRLVTPPPQTRDGVITIQSLIDELRTALSEDGAITIDVGAFKLVLLQQWVTNRPKTVFVANGLSVMGYALPAAVALKMEQPERPVVAVVGDGALMMYAGELATIARSGLPLVVLVVVDEALALIRLKQLRSDVPVLGTEFGSTDYKALAAAFGFDYQLVDQETVAADRLEAALASPGPVLVEARIDKAEYDRFK